MSVIIKGMKMPEKCTACEYFYYEPLLGIQRCKLTNLFIEGYSGDFPKSCPLVELPEHHGRIIDEDKIIVPSLSSWADQVIVANAIMDAHTIIEAE